MSKSHIVLLAFIFCSCSGITGRHHRPLNAEMTYPASGPEIIPLPDQLSEISGICFQDDDSGLLLAIEDENGLIYQLDTGGNLKSEFRFGPDGDYEDISILGDTALVLRSDGTLYMQIMKQAGAGSRASAYKGLVPRGEYEGLFADKKNREIRVLLKSGRGSQRAVLGYVLGFGKTGKLEKRRPFTVPFPPGLHHFHPSALSADPLTGDWYFLSSAEHLLLVAKRDLEIRQVISLDPKVFEQPEGITFSRGGTLYIASEKGRKKKAFLMKYAKEGE